MEDTLEKAGGEETMSDKLKVNMNEYLPLRDVVFNTLRQAIITGEFAPGERLMEIALANRLGVSRTPVREAIRKLELERLVVMIPRKGAEVARITEKDLRDVLEVRCSLEELAAELAATEEAVLEAAPPQPVSTPAHRARAVRAAAVLRMLRFLIVFSFPDVDKIRR